MDIAALQQVTNCTFIPTNSSVTFINIVGKLRRTGIESFCLLFFWTKNKTKKLSTTAVS